MRTYFFTLWVASALLFMLVHLGIGVREGLTQPPPVAAPLIREGAFAMSLAEALGVGHPTSEAEAESMLGMVGIAPRNGWIADYPVTPDIIGELQDSVSYAAEAQTIPMDQDSALKILASVQAGTNISLSPGPAGLPPDEGATETTVAGSAYPDQATVDNYYSQAGPPILTYYAPPPAFYYLYAWVPYPFWWGRLWFGGFFVLNDFHRHFVENGHVVVISNHFNDITAHKVFRIDPVNRYNGRTFAGIGAPRSSAFINTGTQRARERVFNSGPSRPFAPRSKNTTGKAGQSSPASFGTANPFSADRVYSQPPGAGRKGTRQVEGTKAKGGEAARQGR